MPAVVPATLIRRGQRGRVALASLGFSLHQSCEALVPIVVGIAIDVAIAPSDPWLLLGTLAVLAVVFLTLLSVWRMGELAATRAYVETTYGVRRGLIARLLAPRVSFPGPAGQMLSTLSSDVDEAATVVWTISRAIASGAAVLTASIALLVISPPLAALVLVGTPVVMVVLHFCTRPLERRSSAEQEALAASSALAGDLLSGLRSVKGLGAEDEAIRRFRHVNERSLRAALRASYAEGAFTGVSSLISGAYLVLLAAIASAAVVAGDLTPGQLVTVVGLAQFLQWPVAGLGLVGAQMARARASAERTDVLAGTVARPGIQIEHGPGDVRIRGLRLPSGGELTLDVPAGSMVGLVLDEEDAIAAHDRLAGLGRSDDGHVHIDGVPLVGPPAAGARPGLIAPPHEPALFTGTVGDNVVPRGSALDDAHVRAAAEAAALSDILLVEGWGREIGERGRLLSGGQRQRVALARALAADPAVLVLREPATSVDAVTQAGIAEGIRRHRAGRTTLLFTTSPALLSMCDVLVDASGEEVAVVDAATSEGRTRA